MSHRPDDALVRRLVGFGRELRDRNLEVGPSRVQDALRALQVVGPFSRDEAYWALRGALISRFEDIEVFDQVFTDYWAREVPESDLSEEEGLPVPDEDEPEEDTGDEPVGGSEETDIIGGESGDEEGEDPEETVQGAVWSATERLRDLDFASYTPEELKSARRILERVARSVPRRLSRRLEVDNRGSKLDKRRTLRQAMRTEGVPLSRSWRRRKLVARKLVFLVDVSGSMEPYARAMVMFLQAAVGAGRKVEGFTFGTRLTRVTSELQSHDPDRALRAAAKSVPDWAGGTLIGENIKAFNDRFGRWGYSRGATMVIVSDGWERADASLLGREMQRLHRVAHTVVWVNPLAGEAGYEPLAQGMAAALPHVDVFLPGHNLKSLETLAQVLEELPTGRTGRGLAAGHR